MEIDKRLVRKHFDRRAAEYDEYARVQAVMANHLIGNLSEWEGEPVPKRILEIGCGTGNLTKRLAARYPEARMTGLDFSGNMIREAKTRLSSAAEGTNIEWIEADAEEWVRTATGAYDLIVSNATIQWFQEPVSTLSAYCKLVRPGGRLCIATFGSRTFEEFHAACRMTDQALGMPHVRRGLKFLQLDEWRRLGGEWEEELVVEYHADLLGFMNSVRKIGASSAERNGAVLSRPYLRELERIYRSMCGTVEGLPATYHLIYGYYAKR